MPDRTKRPRLISTGVVITLIVILVIAGLYLARVSSKLSSLKQRNFRIAAALAEMTEKKIDNVGKILNSEIRNVENGQLSNRNRLANLPCFYDVHWHSDRHEDLKSDQLTIEADAGVLDFRLMKTSSDESGLFEALARSIDVAGTRRGFVGVVRTLEVLVRSVDLVGAWQGLEGFVRRFDVFVGTSNEFEPESSEPGTLHVRARLDCFFSHLGDAEEQAFDDVLVVDRSKRVIFQRGDSSVRIRQLSAAPGSEEKNATSQGRTKQDDEAGFWPISLSNLQQLKVGGQQYAMFHQPLRPGFVLENERTKPVEWEVIGIVRSDRLLSEALRFPPSLLAYLVAAFLLLFCILPIIEVWASSARQRIHARQVWSTSLGLALGAAILSLLTLDIGLKWWHQRSLKEKLSHSADEIEKALEIQIEEAVKQLEYLTKAYTNPDMASDLCRDSSSGNLFKEADLWKQNDDPQDPHPHISMVFWTDKNGKQVAKWAVSEEPTPMIDVGEREYFQRAKSGKLWSPNAWNGKHWAPDQPYGDKPAPFFAQAIRSWTTGTQELIISQRMDATWKDSDDAPAVNAMIVTKLPSMLRPVVPPGHGFAVINTDVNADGNSEVIFHSQPERNGAENFLKECEEAAELQGAIFSDIEHDFTARYWGRQRVMFARPLVGLPWHIVVFQENDLLQTARFEAIEVALVLLFAEAVLLVLALLAFRLAIGGGAFRMLWPAPDDVQSYARIIAVSMLMIVGIFVSIRWPHSPLLLVSAGLLFPLVTLTWVWSATTTHRASSTSEETAQRPHHRWLVWGTGLVAALLFLLCEGWAAVKGNGSEWLVLLFHAALFTAAGTISWNRGETRLDPIRFLPNRFRHLSPTAHFTMTGLGLLAAISILPAAAFLWAATLDRLHLEARRGQLHLARGLTDRYWTIQSDYPNLDKRMMRAVIDDMRDIHYGGYFETDATASELSAGGDDLAPPPPSLFHFWPLRKFYYLNRHSIEARAVGEKLPDTAWWSWTAESGKLVLRGSPPVAFPEMSIGPLRFAPLGSSLAAASLIAIIFVAGLGACIVFVGRKIFHVDLKPVEIASLEELHSAPFSRLLLVVPPRTDLSDAFADAGVKVDLSSLGTPDGNNPLDKLRNRDPDAQLIRIDHFETLLANPAARAQALPLFEAALDESESGLRIVVISHRDPMAVLEAEETRFDSASVGFLEQTAGSQRRPQAVLQRWREVLARFSKRWTVLNPAKMENRLKQKDDAYFRDLWQTLNTDQRHLLTQIATGSLVNEGLRQPLRRLLGWNLVERDHLTFHLNRVTDGRLAEFIRGHSDLRALRQWEEEAAIGLWRHIRVPFYATLALIVLFLLVTQRELFDVTFGLLSAGAGSLAAIIKIFDSLRKSR